MSNQSETMTAREAAEEVAQLCVRQGYVRPEDRNSVVFDVLHDPMEAGWRMFSLIHVLSGEDHAAIHAVLKRHHAPPAWRKVSDGLPEVGRLVLMTATVFGDDEYWIGKVTHWSGKGGRSGLYVGDERLADGCQWQYITPAPPLPDPVGEGKGGEG